MPGAPPPSPSSAGKPRDPSRDLTEMRFAVLGAGIAGLASAAALLRRGARHVTVFEQEPIPFCGASGRNAAIYRPLEADRALTALAKESLPLLEHLQAQALTPLLEKTGLLLLDVEGKQLERMHENAQALGVPSEASSTPSKFCPGVPLTHQGPGLFSADGGVLDPHEIGLALMRTLHQHEVQFRFNTTVLSLTTTRRDSQDARPACVGLSLEGGESFDADAVILAAGAQSARLAHAAGSSIPLVPLQRHLAVLATEEEYPRKAPVIWRQNPELYFRPETGGVLVSPCDETPQASPLAQSSLDAFETIGARLSATCPPLAESKIRRHWACIRTKSLDGRPVIGADPQLEGLYWISGLGGFGMTCGLAAGEHLANQVANGESPSEFSPRRFLLPYRPPSA